MRGQNRPTSAGWHTTLADLARERDGPLARGHGSAFSSIHTLPIPGAVRLTQR